MQNRSGNQMDFPGKKEWQEMLHYTEALHIKCSHPAETPFPYPWEEIGSGYCYGPGFGHWDIVHAVMDGLHTRPGHALRAPEAPG
jgi:putative isomerase